MTIVFLLILAWSIVGGWLCGLVFDRIGYSISIGFVRLFFFCLACGPVAWLMFAVGVGMHLFEGAVGSNFIEKITDWIAK